MLWSTARKNNKQERWDPIYVSILRSLLAYEYGKIQAYNWTIIICSVSRILMQTRQKADKREMKWHPIL